MKKLMLFPLLVLGLSFAACNKNNAPEGSTKMNIKMTDSPGNYDAIILNVKEVNVITSGGQATLPVNAGAFDILQYRDGKDTLVASDIVPSGTLQEIRLVLEPTGNKVIVDGVSHDLITPSGQESGVKVKIQSEVVQGVAYTLLLDFDAAKSIVKTGNGGYILKPVIRGIPSAVSGAITGMVTPIASYPKIYAINGTDTIGTIIDSLGHFYFNGAPASTYHVDFQVDSPYVSKSIPNVMVTNGSVTDLGTVNITKSN
ncbi:MAG: DUF4382 domain-containing protein [Sphingobacteriales bacterium]|nr:DUF4382 domain-containing protein [Sphingobacteriales bacterium]